MSRHSEVALQLLASDVGLKLEILVVLEQCHYGGQDFIHQPELVNVRCKSSDISHVSHRAVHSYFSNCHHVGDAVSEDGFPQFTTSNAKNYLVGQNSLDVLLQI